MRTAELGADEQPSDHLGEDSAILGFLGSGWASFERDPPTADLIGGPSFDDGSFAHPFLAAAGAFFAYWRGWESFHAGAVARDGKAAMVLGEKAAGKTTAMAWLARRGWQVLADDLTVVDDSLGVLAAPRCLDLRPEGLGVAGVSREETQPVRDGERLRLELGDVLARCELVGSLLLETGSLAVERLTPGERLQLVRKARSISLPAMDMTGLLDIAALPLIRLRRPLDPAHMIDVERELSDLLAA